MNFLKRLISIFAGFFIFSTASSQEKPKIHMLLDKGFGKRSSAFEYRKTNRGGVGIANMQLGERNGSQVVASFPITDNDQLMLVTDKGKLIRCPVNDIRIAGRQTQGVTLFNVSDEEKVVSVAKLEENE